MENSCEGLWFWRSINSSHLEVLSRSEQVILLGDNDANNNAIASLMADEVNISPQRDSGCELLLPDSVEWRLPDQVNVIKDVDDRLHAKGRWTRCMAAKVSILICPFWFFSQLTFNLSLKYTTITSNTILSSVSSLFTFMVSLAFLGLYAVYISLIRKKFPDDDGKSGHANMAQFFGYLGLFNMLLFLPVALVLNFTKVEPFYTHTWKQLGLIVGKGLLDSVLGDYLWAEAVLLTSTTVATAGIAIQVPLAAIADTFTGNAPGLLDYLGAVAAMIGFAGINILSGAFGKSSAEESLDSENENISSSNEDHTLPRSQVSAA